MGNGVRGGFRGGVEGVLRGILISVFIIDWRLLRGCRVWFGGGVVSVSAVTS